MTLRATLRYLFGILIVQAACIGLVLVAEIDPADWRTWLPTLIAVVTIGLVAAFWFATVASNLRRSELERVRHEFAREREDLRVKAEREKTRLLRKNHKTLSSETRRADARANRKVAVAVAAASAVGVVMMFASSLALGLSLLTGAGGALGGYLAGRRALEREGGDTDLLAAPQRRLRRLIGQTSARSGKKPTA